MDRVHNVVADLERERDRAIETMTAFFTLLQTMTDDRDRFAELYDETMEALLAMTAERDLWKAKMTQKIRIMVVPVREAPQLHTIEVDWKLWYKLISPSTDTLLPLPLGNGLELLCDEAAGDAEVNVLIPAHSPKLDTTLFDFVLTRGGGMAPNESGIGVHVIHGTFLIARREGPTYVDLTDEDVARLTIPSEV
jgi:plasmid maintenance system antidote protein VapI